MIQTILHYLETTSKSGVKGFVYDVVNGTLAIDLDNKQYILVNRYSANKPTVTGNFVGEMSFSTVQERLYVWNGTTWIDVCATKRGATGSRPSLSSSEEGFTFYDTTLKKMILWNGTAWVNLDGTALT